jgi:monoamine oxidase
MEQTGSRIALHFSNEGKARTLKFARVICAVPFTMLRQVEGLRALPLSKEKQKAIAEFGYGNNSKVMSGFTERWWRDPAAKLPALSNGSTFTDLPYQCSWETSRGQKGKRGILTNFLGGAPAQQLTTERYDTFRQELARVFPGIENKFDSQRAVMNWQKHPFTHGSYSCPLVGQFTTMLTAAATPELDGRLIFAGEHTSAAFSGFMNGAVESGNRAAREILEPKLNELPKAA